MVLECHLKFSFWFFSKKSYMVTITVRKGFAWSMMNALWEDRSPLPTFISDKLIFQNNGNIFVVTVQHKTHNEIILKMKWTILFCLLIILVQQKNSWKVFQVINQNKISIDCQTPIKVRLKKLLKSSTKLKEIPKSIKLLFYFAKTYIQRKLTNAFTLEWLVKNAIYSHGFAGFTHHACNLLQVVNVILFEPLYQKFNISKLDSSLTNIRTFMQGKISSCRISLRILGEYLKK